MEFAGEVDAVVDGQRQQSAGSEVVAQGEFGQHDGGDGRGRGDAQRGVRPVFAGHPHTACLGQGGVDGLPRARTDLPDQQRHLRERLGGDRLRPRCGEARSAGDHQPVAADDRRPHARRQRHGLDETEIAALPPHPVDDGRGVLHGQSDADVRMGGPEGREVVGHEVFGHGQRGTDLDGSGTGFLDGTDPGVEGAVGFDDLRGPLGDGLPFDGEFGPPRRAPQQRDLEVAFEVAQAARGVGLSQVELGRGLADRARISAESHQQPQSLELGPVLHVPEIMHTPIMAYQIHMGPFGIDVYCRCAHIVRLKS